MKGKTARNANGTFSSTKKAATAPETPPFIEVTPPAPSDNFSDESEVEPEPLIVFFDHPEDLDYVYVEADRDEEDVLRNVQAMKQLKALNLEWKAVVKKKHRGRGKKLFEEKHKRTKQRDAKAVNDRIAQGFSPTKSTLKQTTVGSYFMPKVTPDTRISSLDS
ncbi:hypothetical protein QFC22_003771 [Naganishia vaughanmartiniae]|uniref:Uncharacterized protein n=1 Tax=Naganishia vaughanmartiniae TaxID=1424756 RepID=A0ACC2X4H3_9TREE|nr:hypothetical protein QFC22_003771 [Naganishia vaughanmartiniae]